MFDLSEIEICARFEDDFCARKQILDHFSFELEQCRKKEVEKHFKGMVNTYEDISYYPKFMDEDMKTRMLMSLYWGYQSNSTTIREEILIYDSKDLLAWIGGALGIFVGYSLFDISKHIIDIIFLGIFKIRK